MQPPPPPTFADVGPWAAWVRRVHLQSPRGVLIDGMDGIGKTTVAKQLGLALSAPVLHGDDYLTDTQGPYVDCLDLERLRRDWHAGCEQGGVVIYESVLALAVMERIQPERPWVVYVEHRSPEGRWVHEDIAMDIPTAEELLAEEAEQLRRAGLPDTPHWLPYQLIRYHKDRRAYFMADAYFHTVF